MKPLKRLGLLLDVALLATSVTTDAPIGEQIRIIALVVASVIGALVVFMTAVLTMAVVQQKQPPYRM